MMKVGVQHVGLLEANQPTDIKLVSLQEEFLQHTFALNWKHILEECAKIRTDVRL